MALSANRNLTSSWRFYRGSCRLLVRMTFGKHAWPAKKIPIDFDGRIFYKNKIFQYPCLMTPKGISQTIKECKMYAIFAVHCSFVWLEGLSQPEMSLALASDAFHGARIQVMLMSYLLYCLLVICMAMENTYV